MTQARPDAATLLADAIRSTVSGPYGPALASAVTIRDSADVTEVVVGGTRRVLSGGATASDLAPGVEYGGGRRIGTVRASRRARSYRRHTTRQFTRRPYLRPAIAKAAEAVVDRLAAAVSQAVIR